MHLSSITAWPLLATTAYAHFSINYPYWRGDSMTNATMELSALCKPCPLPLDSGSPWLLTFATSRCRHRPVPERIQPHGLATDRRVCQAYNHARHLSRLHESRDRRCHREEFLH